ncbi:hypothetical protein [Streptomyces chattanoogensis]|uniref:hypothetical protein n=1 Tax=Streptomyces chattanoogensis TaxID=66876 RepID=UPI0036CB9C38
MFTAICVVALVALLGLLVDGYGRVREVEKADRLATEAARAGSQAIDPSQAIPGRRLVVDAHAAQAAAQSYLHSSGAAGTARVTDGGRHLTVTVHLTYVAKIWPADMSVTGQGQSSLVHGVDVPEES